MDRKYVREFYFIIGINQRILNREGKPTQAAKFRQIKRTHSIMRNENGTV